VIGGVEFGTPTAQHNGNETHIVGLFLEPGCREMQETLDRYRALRRERVLRIVEALNRAGVTIRPREVFDLVDHGCASRLHVARALIEGGHVRSVHAAFQRWLGPGKPAFVERERPAAAETISLIHRCGGAAVLAHPALSGRDEEITALVEAGMDGIEVHCTEMSQEQQRHYIALAKEHGLLLSGGSDCHGRWKDANVIGQVRVATELVDALRERAASYARTSG
jgi:predicted metal-dependent phosphoesterase TrpH